MIGFRQGKDLKINVITTNIVSMNLTKAYIAYSNVELSDVVTVKECTIVDNIVTATLTNSETSSLLGLYDIEIKIRDSLGKIDTIYADQMQVIKSILPVFPSA